MEQQALAFHKLDQQAVLSALSRHIGKSNGVSVSNLVFEATGHAPDPSAERRCRQIITQLRNAGTAICSHPCTGYYIASNEAELNEACAFLRKRAMTSLQQESRLRKVAMPDLLNQIRMDH